jgi:hypothetical protein
VSGFGGDGHWYGYGYGYADDIAKIVEIIAVVTGDRY